MCLAIKNWEKFQHYKSGRGAPPWIKLYRDILNDKEWFALDPSAAKFMVSLWALAAETDGKLPDSETIAFRLRLAIKDVNKYVILCSHWIIQLDSKMLAECYQVATPETDTETDTETDKKSPNVDLFSGISAQVASDFKAMRSKQKAPITKTAILGITREADIAGISLEAALTICCERNWRGFKAEWLQAKPSAGGWQDKRQAADEITSATIRNFGKQEMRVIGGGAA